MNKLNAYLNLIRFYNPIGFWLLLWPGMWGLFMSENFEIKHFAVVLIGAFLTRSLGCAINDYFDIGFDSQVKRTKNRPLANKTLSKVEALICIIFWNDVSIYSLFNELICDLICSSCGRTINNCLSTYKKISANTAVIFGINFWFIFAYFICHSRAKYFF